MAPPPATKDPKKQALPPQLVRTLIAGGLFLAACGLVTMVCAVVVGMRGGHWIELFNGATWPPAFVEGQQVGGGSPDRSIWFYVILGFRTTLNLGIVLSTGYVVYLVISGKWKEMVMSKLESVLSTRDTALAGFLLKRMTDSEYKVSPELREILLGAAAEFRTTEAGRAFLQSALKAAPTPPERPSH